MAIHEIPLEKGHADAIATFVAKVAEVINNPPQLSPLRKDNLNHVPREPGIYAIYENRELIYVGESGCLKERISDLFSTRNHSFRRSFGAERFSNHPEFKPATSKLAFVAEIEAKLTTLCGECLSILIVPVHFGRKEIEEKFVDAGGRLRNKRGRRGR